MEIVRKDKSKTPGFPKWEQSKVVELFAYGESKGLHIMAWVGYDVLVSLESGMYWSNDDEKSPFDGADYAVVVNGKFVEE